MYFTLSLYYLSSLFPLILHIPLSTSTLYPFNSHLSFLFNHFLISHSPTHITHTRHHLSLLLPLPSLSLTVPFIICTHISYIIILLPGSLVSLLLLGHQVHIQCDISLMLSDNTTLPIIVIILIIIGAYPFGVYSYLLYLY